MATKGAHERIVFGLKMRQLRRAKHLNFVELAELTGISVSYLNEIEKGKKYPKGPKVGMLANALGVSEKNLISDELPPQLAPVTELLQSGFLNELPLELFGIDPAKVIDMIAAAPARVGAFVTTLVDLSRNYAMMREEHFYFGALRAILEMHNNYFGEIESLSQAFAMEFGLRADRFPESQRLKDILYGEYGVEIVEDGLKNYPELAQVRSVYLPKQRNLLLNKHLTESQLSFQLAKELGFTYMQLKERALTASLLRVNSFEEVINHFKASYFAASLLIPQNRCIHDIRDWLDMSTWAEAKEHLLGMMERYGASPEMLFQRMTNMLPQFFGLTQMFFLRIIHRLDRDQFDMNKDLHLGKKHPPQRTSIEEHYCGRWVSVSLLRQLQQLQQTVVGASPMLIEAQRSLFHNSSDEYISLTIARAAYPAPDRNISVTLGILIDNNARKYIKFLNDPAISIRDVNHTCERCPLTNCVERAAPPIIFSRRKKREDMTSALDRLLSDNEPKA